MRTFSIAELEQYSLIKAHTIRAWEKRFGFLKGNRTATNYRYYTLEELDYLLNFSLLNHFGYRVSNLAQMDKECIRKNAVEIKDSSAKQESYIHRLIISMFSLDIENFEFILDTSVHSWGIDETINRVILPFLERLELFSYKGCTTCEYHFVVTAIRSKLILAIEQKNPKELTAKSALLFLPEGEHFDLLLLYLNYQLRRAGFNVLYLGSNMDGKNLQEVIAAKKPHFVVMYIYPKSMESLHRIVHDYFSKDEKILYVISVPKPVVPLPASFTNIKLANYKEVVSAVKALA